MYFGVLVSFLLENGYLDSNCITEIDSMITSNQLYDSINYSFFLIDIKVYLLISINIVY